MTENAQFWFNQELIAPPPMACAGHKTRMAFCIKHSVHSEHTVGNDVLYNVCNWKSYKT